MDLLEIWRIIENLQFFTSVGAARIRNSVTRLHGGRRGGEENRLGAKNKPSFCRDDFGTIRIVGNLSGDDPVRNGLRMRWQNLDVHVGWCDPQKGQYLRSPT